MNGLDLFSGIGGISYALREWVKPVAYCEINAYCQGVLLSNMERGRLHVAPIWDDIRTFPSHLFATIDLIYGGFPCQNISIAGDRKGLGGKDSGLFYSMYGIINYIRPRFVFLENTPGILSNGGVEVVEKIASLGYDVRWIVKSCRSIGAPHPRKRWFMLAHSQSQRLQEERLTLGKEETFAGPNSISKYDAHYKWETSPPPFYRVDDDLSFRVDRTHSLGNSVCVEQTKKAFQELIGF